MAEEKYLDPAVEYARKPKDESKPESKPLTGSDIAGIIGFFVMWAVYTGLFIWAATDAGWNIFLAIAAAIVGGFIAAIITFFFASAGGSTF